LYVHSSAVIHTDSRLQHGHVPYFIEYKPGFKYKPGLEYKPRVVVYTLIESDRYALSGRHWCASWHDMKLLVSIFWLPYFKLPI